MNLLEGKDKENEIAQLQQQMDGLEHQKQGIMALHYLVCSIDSKNGK